MDATDKERIAVIEERTRSLPMLCEKVYAHDVEIATIKAKLDTPAPRRKRVPWGKIFLGLFAAIAAFFGGKVQS